MSALLTVLALLPSLLPLDVTTSPAPVHPPQDSGFAYLTLLGGFFGVALIMLLYVLLNLKPKRRQPYTGPND